MPFGLKNAGATYMRAMTTIFHDIIHRETEVYVDDVIIKSKKQSDHVKDLRKFFQRLRRYNLKLNLAKCAFGVPSGKLLGFVVSRRGIELDPSKIKAIQELPPPKNKTELLKKNVAVKWTDECQEAFDKIKMYLSNSPVLVPPEPGRPLILYLTVLDNSFGLYLSEAYAHGKTGAKWQILLTEFDIIYVTRTAMKAQGLADHLDENPVDNDYEPLKTYFPNEEVMCVDEVDHDEKPGWKLSFDGAANMKGVGIGVVLISETGQHYPVIAQLRFYCTNNMAEHEACILGLRLAIELGVQEILVLEDSDLLTFLRIHNEIADALDTLASMLHHPDKAYVDPVHIQVHDQHAYCNVVEEEIDGEPWFHDIKGIHQVGVISSATPYSLVYGTEAVIPAEVEISSLQIVAEAKIDDDEWVKTWLEQLSLIDEKQMAAVEAKGKFVPNWQGPFIVTRVLPNGSLYLTDIEGKCVDMAINSDAVKRGKKIFKSTGTSHGKAWFREQEILFRILKDESMAHVSSFSVLRTLLDNGI
ncbi:uncharacterized protein [Nicotiana sylvestris]|uniref:uncharacterized protein n=1 Tax=Nicotiana sylvestris TaxID=4096 RepID=UPI00388CCC3E